MWKYEKLKMFEVKAYFNYDFNEWMQIHKNLNIFWIT